jgi:hypothetical protein
MSYYAVLFSFRFDTDRGPGAEGIHLFRGSLTFLRQTRLADAIQSDAQIPPSASHSYSKWESEISRSLAVAPRNHGQNMSSAGKFNLNAEPGSQLMATLLQAGRHGDD